MSFVLNLLSITNYYLYSLWRSYATTRPILKRCKFQLYGVNGSNVFTTATLMGFDTCTSSTMSSKRVLSKVNFAKSFKMNALCIHALRIHALFNGDILNLSMILFAYTDPQVAFLVLE